MILDNTHRIYGGICKMDALVIILMMFILIAGIWIGKLEMITLEKARRNRRHFQWLNNIGMYETGRHFTIYGHKARRNHPVWWDN